MAKTKKNVPAVQDKKKNIKLATSGGVPTFLNEKQMKGRGVSSDMDDNLIPMARILQDNSPEVKKGSATKIPGAEPGDILIKNTPNPIIKGEDGFLFQPCYFDKGVVEWKPRNQGGGGGGGFVARHKVMPKDAEQKPDPQNAERLIWVRKSTKNILVDTRYHAGFLIMGDGTPMPLVIPFASTGHSVSRGWTTQMGLKRLNGEPVDSWAVYYKLSSTLRTKGEQSWYVFSVKDAGEEDDKELPTTQWVPSEEDYERGASLHEALSKGEKQFAAEDTADEAASDKM